MLYIYMVTFTINIPQMLAYIPDMDPMGIYIPYMVGSSKKSWNPESWPLQGGFILSWNGL